MTSAMSLWKRWFPSGMRKRWWGFRLVDLAASLAPRGRKGGLLIVRMDGIGDILLFRPFLDLYAEAFGVAQKDITILASRNWSDLIAPFFAGYRVIHMVRGREQDRDFEHNPWFRFKTQVWLRRQGFDAVVCDSYFRKTLMHDSLLLACGAPDSYVTVPYQVPKTQREFDWYLAHFSHVVETGPYPQHEMLRHHRFLEAVAGRALSRPRMQVAWRDQAPPLPPGKPYAVVNFGSNAPGRNWPLASYLGIARRALDAGLRVVFVGGAKDSWASAEIGAALSSSDVVDMIGKTDLSQLMDILKHAALVFSNETGPGHLAILLGSPTVMIHGGGYQDSFVPYPPDFTPPTARFLSVAMECAPCTWRCDKRARDTDPYPCVAMVSEQRVWQAAVELLEPPAA